MEKFNGELDAQEEEAKIGAEGEVNEDPASEWMQTLICIICVAPMTDRKAFFAHLRSHKTLNEIDMVCPFCQRQWTLRRDYTEHLRRHLKHFSRESKSCMLCFRKFTNPYHVQRHIKENHEEALPWLTGNGKLEVSTIQRKAEPTKRKAEPVNDVDNPPPKRVKDIDAKIFSCIICNKQFHNKATYCSHIDKKHGYQGEHTCIKCEMPFSSPHLLFKHHSMHITDEKQSKVYDSVKEQRTCASCRSEFADVEEVAKHLCQVEESQCYFCMERFITLSGFWSHLTEHLSATVFFNCSICDWRSHIKVKYVKHIAEHSAHPQPFQCDQCQYRTKDYVNLKKHQRMHDDRFVFTCYVCGLRITSVNTIREHMMAKHKIHDIKKPYSCDKCSRQCYSLGALEAHKTRHQETSTFRCTMCDEMFPSIAAERLHRQKLHLGHAFVCDVCGAKFTAKRLLNKHAKKHIQVDLPCEICGEIFSSPTVWIKHWYGHKEAICKCTACNHCMTKASLPHHRNVHLQLKTRVNKHCALCGEMLETVEDILKHAVEHRYVDCMQSKIVLPDDLIEHSADVDIKAKAWACTICCDIFYREQDWMEHLMNHKFSIDKTKKCRLCDGLFIDKAKFIKHISGCVKRKKMRNACLGWSVGVNLSDFIGLKKNSKAKKNELRKASSVELSVSQGSVSDEKKTVHTINLRKNPRKSFLLRKDSQEEIKEKKQVSLRSKGAQALAHPSSRPIVCVLCLQLFASARGLAYHLLTTCDEFNSDTCWRCYSIFQGPTQLKTHITNKAKPCQAEELPSIASSASFCSHCDKAFIDDVLLQCHFSQNHEAGEYPCVRCSRKFEYRKELEMHVYEHVDSKKQAKICSVCGYLSKSLGDLQNHISDHRITIDSVALRQ